MNRFDTFNPQCFEDIDLNIFIKEKQRKRREEGKKEGRKENKRKKEKRKELKISN